jgi:mono/diheme cytochrome c family protein
MSMQLYQSGVRGLASTGTLPKAAHAEWRRPDGDGLRQTLQAIGVALLIALPIAAAGTWMITADIAERRRSIAEAAERAEAHVRLVSAPALPTLPAAEAAHGRDLFMGTCVACHGQDAKGMPGLGKDLTTSAFVAAADDAVLRAFLANGRPAAKPVGMPPRGGNADLTDEDLKDIVAYLRGVQDPRRMPDLPAPVIAAAPAPTEAEKAKALAAAGGDEELAGYIAHGAQVFGSSCVACHGKDARGLPGSGKDLVQSAFCKSLDDDALLAFVKKGRDPSDPLNTTGVGMPAKGGNPALSDDDLLDVIAYVRSLQTAAK